MENVAAPLLYARGKAYYQRRRSALEMLDRVGLSAARSHAGEAVRW